MRSCIGATLFATKGDHREARLCEGVMRDPAGGGMILSLPVYLVIGMHALMPRGGDLSITLTDD